MRIDLRNMAFTMIFYLQPIFGLSYAEKGMYLNSVFLKKIS